MFEDPGTQHGRGRCACGTGATARGCEPACGDGNTNGRILRLSEELAVVRVCAGETRRSRVIGPTIGRLRRAASSPRRRHGVSGS